MLSEKDIVRLLFRQRFVPRLCAFLSCVFRIHAGQSGVPDAGGLWRPGPTAVRLRGIRLVDASPKDL